jgi:hypothetical protein
LLLDQNISNKGTRVFIENDKRSSGKKNKFID